jgi:hypothetical protein
VTFNDLNESRSCLHLGVLLCEVLSLSPNVDDARPRIGRFAFSTHTITAVISSRRLNRGDATVDLAAAKLAYDALKFAYGILKDLRLGKKDKRKIGAEAEKLIVLAHPSDIDKEVKRRRWRTLRSPAKKARPKRKRAARIAKKRHPSRD